MKPFGHCMRDPESMECFAFLFGTNDQNYLHSLGCCHIQFHTHWPDMMNRIDQRIKERCCHASGSLHNLRQLNLKKETALVKKQSTFQSSQQKNRLDAESGYWCGPTSCVIIVNTLLAPDSWVVFYVFIFSLFGFAECSNVLTCEQSK